MTVPAKSSRLESNVKAEGFEAACSSEDTFKSSGLRYQPIPANGANASDSTGTIHGRASLI